LSWIARLGGYPGRKHDRPVKRSYDTASLLCTKYASVWPR
jgi:hypothetical protein